MITEFGDYYDNVEVLRFAVRQIQLGLVQEGMEMLLDLRNHIKGSEETKSQRYLLPNIDFYERYVTEHKGFTCGQSMANDATAAKLT